jgi:hypothetical protein
MAKKYSIKKVKDSRHNFTDNSFWDVANTIKITEWPWHTSDLPAPPKITVKALYSSTHFFIKYQVYENFIQAKHTGTQSMVCQDSCVEFFAAPNDKGYFNFELNCIGTVHLGYGKERHNRIKIKDSDLKQINISTSLPKGIAISSPIDGPKNGYSVSYSIPFSLFEKYSNTEPPQKGTVWNANFYKCGDLTPEPSWGAWNPVKTPQPDFHRPEFFGEIIFE